MAPSLIQTKNTSAAIATYAIICASIYGLLAFGFHTLMQPMRIPNIDLARGTYRRRKRPWFWRQREMVLIANWECVSVVSSTNQLQL